jgi:hypothetical protein
MTNDKWSLVIAKTGLWRPQENTAENRKSGLKALALVMK